MKNNLRIFSLFMILVLALSVLSGCNTNTPNGGDPLDDTKVTVYWCQGQKILKEEPVEIGSLVKDWTPKVSGKEFLGWYSNPGCTVKFDFSKPITAETEIFASFKTTGVVDEEPVYADYYLVGKGVGDLRVSNWDQQTSAQKLGMTDIGNAKYSITIDFYAGDAFQICYNLSWEGQMGIGYVAGAALVEGSETEAEVRDAEGNVVFKGSAQYEKPMTEWNITCAPGQDGKYTFTVDVASRIITWELVERLDPDSYPKVEEGDHTYTLAGPVELCGEYWNPSFANNNLVLDDATGLLKIEFAGILAGTYGFKICQDYGWAVAYGNPNSGDPDGNYLITVAADNTKVIITFNFVTHEIKVTDENGNDLTAGGGSSTPVDPSDCEIIIVGTVNEWNTTNPTGEWALTEGEDGKTWTGVFTFDKEVQLKLFDKSGACGHDGGWIDPASTNAGTFDADGNLVLAEGTYNFKYVVGEAKFVCYRDGEEPAAPAVPTEATTIYFVPGLWTSDNARMALYTWNDGGNLWIDMTDADGDGVYECMLPAGYVNVIFCRMNPETTENNWDNSWNQTKDLTLSGNCFTVNEGEWDNANGTWSDR